MKIAFFVNNVRTEDKGYTTTRLAMTALNRGHEIWYIGAEDLALDPDDTVRARATSVHKDAYKTTESFMKDLQGPKAVKKRINVDELDILLLRSDPSSETGSRFWAQQTGVLFGRVAMRHGVMVLNDPTGLGKAMNKMYFQTFPEEVRPTTLITRDRNEIKEFAKEYGTIVIKPLQGSGGASVFVVRPEDVPNMNQMIDAVSRDGFLVCQSYLEAAAEGDTRLFVMNGQPLKYRGKYAAFRRVRMGGDLRSNIHAGGKLRQAEIGPEALRLAEIVRPKLVQDGMFLVGLDIVGDKLMEINVFSPGGLGSAQRFEKVNFNVAVIESLERKVEYMKFYRRRFDNVDIATL